MGLIMKGRVGFILFLSVIMSSAYALEKASEERLDEVARRGVFVMPFDLDLTVHVFSKKVTGGLQQVVVKDPADAEQIILIREHLIKIVDEFRQRDFSDPANIHGDNMPGLKELHQAKPSELSIVYNDLPKGAEVMYSSDKSALIKAIHQWFDAQLSDHARHAVSGHAMHHKMHQQLN